MTTTYSHKRNFHYLLSIFTRNTNTLKNSGPPANTADQCEPKEEHGEESIMAGGYQLRGLMTQPLEAFLSWYPSFYGDSFV